MLFNRTSNYKTPLDLQDALTFSVEQCRNAHAFWMSASGYSPTPLHSLPALSRKFNVAEILVKDESCRLGLSSFKSLGGAYAVITVVLDQLQSRLQRKVNYEDLQQPDIMRITAGITICCATDGNHGRSVAYGAKLAGVKAVIFVHPGVSRQRRSEIENLDALVVEVPGTYDDSVNKAAGVSNDQGWTLIADTSWPGYEYIPSKVMQGYTLLVNEAIGQAINRPTHIFIQAGVGGLAAAVAGYLVSLYGDNRPQIVVVEPERAGCLYGSAEAGHLVKIAHTESTVMAMLECYQPSLVAWRILSKTAAAFLVISDDEAIQAMNLLARPNDDDPVIISGESGCAGLAGFIHVCRNSCMKDMLTIDNDSRILFINTEGATDPQRYEELVGLNPENIRHTNQL